MSSIISNIGKTWPRKTNYRTTLQSFQHFLDIESFQADPVEEPAKKSISKKPLLPSLFSATEKAKIEANRRRAKQIKKGIRSRKLEREREGEGNMLEVGKKRSKPKSWQRDEPDDLLNYFVKYQMFKNIIWNLIYNGIYDGFQLHWISFRWHWFPFFWINHISFFIK